MVAIPHELYARAMDLLFGKLFAPFIVSVSFKDDIYIVDAYRRDVEFDEEQFYITTAYLKSIDNYAYHPDTPKELIRGSELKELKMKIKFYEPCSSDKIAKLYEYSELHSFQQSIFALRFKEYRNILCNVSEYGWRPDGDRW